MQMRLVLRIFMVGIDLQRVPLDHGAQQIKARVLIPSPAFIEINEGQKTYDAEKDCRLVVGRGSPRLGGHRVFRTRVFRAQILRKTGKYSKLILFIACFALSSLVAIARSIDTFDADTAPSSLSVVNDLASSL